jgi:hypothetical protein
MTRNDKPDRTAEVLRLGLVEGVGVRAIARRLGMARKTVRQILGRSLPHPIACSVALSWLGQVSNRDFRHMRQLPFERTLHVG